MVGGPNQDLALLFDIIQIQNFYLFLQITDFNSFVLMELSSEISKLC